MENKAYELILNIKTVMLKQSIKQKDVLEYLIKNYKSTYTKSLLSNKFKTGKFNLDEFLHITEFLGLEINLQKK